MYKHKGSFKFTGKVKSGIKEGFGIEDNDDYCFEGDFTNGKMHGKGKIYYKKQKDSYEGSFQKGFISGFGIYTWRNKEAFTGNFYKGNMSGEGLYKWPSGIKFHGYYSDNVKEGPGEFKLLDGRILKISFIKGKPDGNGILIDKKHEKSVSYKEIKELIKSTLNSKSNNSLLENCDKEFLKTYVDDKFC